MFKTGIKMELKSERHSTLCGFHMVATKNLVSLGNDFFFHFLFEMKKGNFKYFCHVKIHH